MYRLTNQIIDQITGFPIRRTLEQVLAMDSWDREKIREYQRTQFRVLSTYAASSSFYGSYTGKELEDLPIVSREDFQENRSAFLTNLRKIYHTSTTSGSTGTPFSFPVSREMLLQKRVSHQKMLKWYGIAREASELKLGGVEVGVREKIYYLLRNKRYLDITIFLNREFEKAHRIYSRFKPSVLYGYPSSIHEFITESANRGIELHIPAIVVTHAETLYDHIYADLKRFFPGSKIINQYWATEANIGVTCPSGKMHLDEDTVICEVTDPDEHGIGDLVVTNLFSYDFPLIRYKIGDRGGISDEECPCGRKTRILTGARGRKYDEIHLANGKRILLGSYYEIISQIGNIRQFQLIYSRSEDSLSFLCKTESALSLAESERISRFFRDRFRMDIRVEEVDTLQYEPSGKLKVHKTL